MSTTTTTRKRRRTNIGRLLAQQLQVSHPPNLSSSQLMLANDDLKPVEPERRTWGSWNFIAFWISDSFNIATFMISSSSMVDGLSWWQSWLCVWIGYSIAALFVCLLGRIGAQYHISFPVVSRASFGIWGALWPVLNRVVMACVWYGTQAYIGGTTVQLMISSVWRDWDSYAAGGVNNTLHLSNTNTRDFVSFLLFWVCSLPALWFPVWQIRHLFTVKSIVAPIAGIALCVWAVVRANGIGPIIHQPGSLHGSALGWAMIKGIMSAISNFAALILNNDDFTRFAKNRRSALWSQLIAIPAGFAITSLIGIMISSSSAVIFGSAVWSPLTLLQNFLNEQQSSLLSTTLTRLGVFVIAASFTLAQVGTNIAANSISAGTDMTALLPRYITLRRGSYICALFGLVICPWNLIASTTSFLTYLSAYAVFLCGIAGVIASDYYLVRRGFLSAKDLYSADQRGLYYYSYGFNWRAWVAYLAGLGVNGVGFVGKLVGEQKTPKLAEYIYSFNYFCGFFVAAGVYWGVCLVSPVQGCGDVWLEIEDDDGGVNGVDVERDGFSGLDDDEEEDERFVGKGDSSVDCKTPLLMK